MKQKDKKLLLKDLCARLPYKPKALVNGLLATILGIDENVVIVLLDGNNYKDETVVSADDNSDDVKPYLRPMSSMTEEERKKYEILANRCISTSVGFIHFDAQDLINWLLKNHFDYNCLIPKGLAIEVTEENNPYKEIKDII